MKKTLLRLINHIKMGNKNRKSSILIPNKPISIQFINILHKEGYIDYYQILSKNSIKIYFKYLNNRPIIQHMKNISRPSRLISYKYKEIFNENEGKFINDLKVTIKKTNKLNVKKIIPNININYLYHIFFIKSIFNHYKLKKNNFNNYIIKLLGSKKKNKLFNLKKIKSINIKKKNVKRQNIKIKYNKFTINKLKSLEKIELIREAKKINFMNNTLKKFSYINNLDGLLILSTTKGIMTHKDAYKQRLGGVCLCEIY